MEILRRGDCTMRSPRRSVWMRKLFQKCAVPAHHIAHHATRQSFHPPLVSRASSHSRTCGKFSVAKSSARSGKRTKHRPESAKKLTGPAAQQRIDGVRIGLRILSNSAIAIGPGKADLLDAIATTGSISAAARQMGMSYRRAWLLVDTMNSCFVEPVVFKEKGGVDGGGAELSATGKRVLRKYRQLLESVSKEFASLLRVTNDS